MRKAVLIALVLAFALIPWACAFASGPAGIEQGVTRVMEGVDVRAWEDVLSDFPELRAEGLDVSTIVTKLAMGEAVLSPGEALKLLGAALVGRALDSVPLILRIIVLAAMGGVLTQMRGSLGAEGVSDVVQFVCLGILVVPLTADFVSLALKSRDAVERMSGFMRGSLPVLLSLMVTLGANATAAVMQPAVLAATGIVGVLVANIVLPLLMCAAVLSALCSLSSYIRLDKLRALLQTACHWTLGVSLTVYLAVLAIQGVAASTFDGVAFRTAKYAVDNFVPVVGGMFADTMDSLLSCSVLIKNGLGFCGMLALAALCLEPCVNLLVGIGCYRFAAAVLEPIADARMTAFLGNIAGVLTSLMAAVLSVAAMFFVVVALIVSAGGAVVGGG